MIGKGIKSLSLPLAVAVLAGCGSSEGSPRGLDDITTGPRGGAGGAISVEVYTAAMEPLEETVVTTGELRASEEVTLKSEVSGRITGIFFEEGTRVRSGARLVKINDRELQAELERARLQKELAATRDQRAEKLFDGGALSAEGFDEARSRLSVLQAEVDLIQARIAETEIRAPFSGVIGLREVSVGSYLTPGASIAGLQRLDPIKIDFSVPEKYAGRSAAGDRIEFTVAGLDGPFEGEVYAVEPRIGTETRTVQVRARAANPQGKLLPGAFAKIRWILETRPDALMVPSRALIPGLDETRLYVIEDGVAQPRAVEIGVRTETKVQIRSGLAPGDVVVVGGLQQLQPGALVTIGHPAGTPGSVGSAVP